jgi:hypothetical protein
VDDPVVDDTVPFDVENDFAVNELPGTAFAEFRTNCRLPLSYDQ